MATSRTRFEDDGLKDYLGAVAHHPIMTREDEVALFQRHEAGDSFAREEIIERNLRFVVKVALQFRGCGVPLADLIQEGNIGLMYVVDKYDWRKGFRFSTYAAYYIRQEIQAAIHRQGSMIRLPVRKARLLGKITEVVQRVHELEGRDPSVQEVAAHLGVPAEKVQPLMELRHSFVPIDAERGEDGPTIGESLIADVPAPSDAIDRQQTEAAVYSILDFLTARERQVVELRFGLAKSRAMSLRKASKVVGLSQEGVRRVENRALDKLRRPGIRSRVEGLLTA